MLVKIEHAGPFSVPGVSRTVEVWVAGFLLTLPCAAASYDLFERPLLRLAYRRREAPHHPGLEHTGRRKVAE